MPLYTLIRFDFQSTRYPKPSTAASLDTQHASTHTNSYKCATNSVHDCVYIHTITHTFSAHTYLDGAVPVSADYLVIIILEAEDSLLIFLTVALNTGQRVMTVCPVQLQLLLTRIMLTLHASQYYHHLPLTSPITISSLTLFILFLLPTSSLSCSALSLHHLSHFCPYSPPISIPSPLPSPFLFLPSSSSLSLHPCHLLPSVSHNFEIRACTISSHQYP